MYTLDNNSMKERVNHIFDHEGREYYLEVDYFCYNENLAIDTVIMYLIRCKRDVEVGRASCILESQDMLIGDLIVNDNLEFSNLSDQYFKLTHWNEPQNYRRKGLGTYLLKYIIDLAKIKGIEKMHGSLVEDDIQDNPNLINWYKKHGFRVESPTSEEVSTAKYRICLYL
jgi:hypothetical protein